MSPPVMTSPGGTSQKRPRSKMQAGNWSKIFPASLNTRQQSLSFIKKLVAVGVSNVMYLRSSFPEDAFQDKKLDGLRLKVLNRDGGHADAADLCECVANAFDAVEKGYLRELVLAIMADPDDPATVIETYTFSFEYASQGHGGDDGQTVNLSFSGGSGNGSKSTRGSDIAEKDDIYQQTRLLLHKINVATNNLQVLPEDAYLHVQLNYYEDRTPADYEPPGFVGTDWELDLKEDESNTVETPAVKTRHHALKVKIKSSLAAKEGFASSQKTQQSSQPTAADSTCAEIMDAQQADGDAAATDGVLFCVCGVSAPVSVPSKEPEAGDAGPSSPPGRLYLTCRACSRRQHAECFLVFSASQVGEAGHLCHACAMDADDVAACTDPKLARKLKRGHAMEQTCLFRQVLVRCLRGGNMSGQDIGDLLLCDAGLAEAILDQLIKFGVVAAGSGEIDVAKLEGEVGSKFLGPNFVAFIEGRKSNRAEREADAISSSPMAQLSKDLTQGLNVTEKSGKRKAPAEETAGAVLSSSSVRRADVAAAPPPPKKSKGRGSKTKGRKI